MLSRLDPRAPLVLDTHELGRRPGLSARVSLSVPAPSDIGIAVLGVPEGSPVQVDVLLESVHEGVLASGTARVELNGECARCLDALRQPLEVELQELFVYPESDAEDDEVSRLDHELLDLEQVVREAVVLALPFRPVCSPDCPGLCVECGRRLADDPGHRHAEEVDPRWAALRTLTEGTVSDDTVREDDLHEDDLHEDDLGEDPGRLAAAGREEE